MLMLCSVFTRIIALNAVSQSGNWKWHRQCLECSRVSKHSQGIHLWILPFLLLTSMLAFSLCNKQTRYSIYKRNNEFGHILGTHGLGRTCQTQRLWARISGSAWLGGNTGRAKPVTSGSGAHNSLRPAWADQVPPMRLHLLEIPALLCSGVSPRVSAKG